MRAGPHRCRGMNSTRGAKPQNNHFKHCSVFKYLSSLLYFMMFCYILLTVHCSTVALTVILFLLVPTCSRCERDLLFSHWFILIVLKARWGKCSSIQSTHILDMPRKIVVFFLPLSCLVSYPIIPQIHLATLWGGDNTESRFTPFRPRLLCYSLLFHSSVSLSILLSSGLSDPGYHLPAGEHPGHHSHSKEQEPPLAHVLFRLQVNISVAEHTT